MSGRKCLIIARLSVSETSSFLERVLFENLPMVKCFQNGQR